MKRQLWMIAFAGLLFSARAHAVNIGLNDVSILLPLPHTSAEFARLLPATEGGLIPDAVLKSLPRLVNPDGDPAARLASLRVLGIRFDPCFAEGAGPLTCRRQIRLVLQPVSMGDEGNRTPSTVFDAAVHAFYDFSESDWRAVVTEWRQGIARDTSALPLQVHPTITIEGLTGPTWTRLRKLVTKYCVPLRLSRVTSMSVVGLGTQWIFMGREILSGQPGARINIARIAKPAQAFIAELSNLSEFNARVTPAPPGSDDWLTFLNDSQAARRSLPPARLKAVMADAIAFENPQMHNPGTVDCVSCHVAQTVRLWGENEWRGWRTDGAITKSLFQSARPLANTSENAFHVNRVRAFGYFVDEAVISQRVVNESAAVADAMAR